MNTHHRFIFYWLPVFVLCLLIFINSSYSYPESIPKIPHLDKLIHLMVYAVLGALFFRALRDKDPDKKQASAMILGILFAAVYGISDEIHQYYVPERIADLADAVADFMGSICGVLIYRRLIQKYYSVYPYHSHIDKIENFI